MLLAIGTSIASYPRWRMRRSITLLYLTIKQSISVKKEWLDSNMFFTAPRLAYQNTATPCVSIGRCTRALLWELSQTGSHEIYISFIPRLILILISLVLGCYDVHRRVPIPHGCARHGKEGMVYCAPCHNKLHRNPFALYWRQAIFWMIFFLLFSQPQVHSYRLPIAV